MGDVGPPAKDVGDLERLGECLFAASPACQMNAVKMPAGGLQQVVDELLEGLPFPAFHTVLRKGGSVVFG
jgi:hypothetical protein